MTICNQNFKKIKHKELCTYRWYKIEEERQGNEQTGQAIHTDRDSWRQRGRQIDRQTQRQINREENRQRKKEKEKIKTKVNEKVYGASGSQFSSN